jgi:hypothetical protein
MNIFDSDKYNEIKNILLGCKNINDAKYLTGLYLKKNPESKKMVCSLLYGKVYFDCNDFKTFSDIMNKINECEYQDTCNKLISEFFPFKNNNNIQLKTLTRILNNKKKRTEKKDEANNQLQSFPSYSFFYKNNNIKKIKQSESENENENVSVSVNGNTNKNTKEKENSNSNVLVKYCPHCSEKYISSESTTHVICGYNDSHNGYNWTGCQKDWCFTCGKKLCKSWNENKLYLEPNRIHNSECCKQHAINNGESYNNYCHCNNKYVNRNRK